MNRENGQVTISVELYEELKRGHIEEKQHLESQIRMAERERILIEDEIDKYENGLYKCKVSQKHRALMSPIGFYDDVTFISKDDAIKKLKQTISKQYENMTVKEFKSWKKELNK